MRCPVELSRHLGDIADELARLVHGLAFSGVEEEIGEREHGNQREHRIHAGERVRLVRVHRVQQDDAADLSRVAVGVAEREHATQRVSGKDIRPERVRALEEDVEMGGG